MKTHKGYYSIIQYCPDLSRLEAAKIGVMLFCPELKFLEAMTDEAEARVRQFFGARERERSHIATFRRSIEERLRVDRKRFQTLTDVEELVARRANSIQLTTPRPVKVFDPQADLQHLFAQLVTHNAKRSNRSPTFAASNKRKSRLLSAQFRQIGKSPKMHAGRC
jgi:hypothetical protein